MAVARKPTIYKGRDAVMLRKVIALILIIAIALPLFIPTMTASASGTVRLTVKNKSRAEFVLYLSGPDRYELVIKGTKKFNVVPGIYRYTYTACGTTQVTGTLEITKNTVMTIPKCPPGTPIPLTFLLKNNTGGYLNIVMTGSKGTYNFNLSPGNHNITVFAGKYKYVATGCGGKTLKGKINILGVWFKYWSFSCK